MRRRFRTYRPSRWVRLAWAMLTGRVVGKYPRADVWVRVAEKYPRADVWAILGPHPALWWWVRKWGRLPCHCLRNPLTRRMAAYDSRCRVHAYWGVE